MVQKGTENDSGDDIQKTERNENTGTDVFAGREGGQTAAGNFLPWLRQQFPGTDASWGWLCPGRYLLSFL